MEWDAEAFDRWLTTEPEELPDYEPYIAPCGAEVYGTPRDIDSGIRKHIDQCDDCWDELNDPEDEE